MNTGDPDSGSWTHAANTLVLSFFPVVFVPSKEAVLNLWVTALSGVERRFHKGHISGILHTGYLHYGSEQQQNYSYEEATKSNFVVGGHHTVRNCEGLQHEEGGEHTDLEHSGVAALLPLGWVILNVDMLST